MTARAGLTIASFVALLALTSPMSALASPVCDFDGDGMSEVVLVKPGAKGSYDWSAFNPRTGTTKSVVNSFGNASSKLIPGNWFTSGEAVPAIINPVSGGPNGRAVWVATSLSYDGGRTQVRNLGRTGDLVIQGGDYDGNGIADSLILKRTTGKLGLRVNYFLSSYNGNNLGKERLYRALGSPFKDRNFFFSPDGTLDYLAVLRRGANGGATALQLKPFTDSPQVLNLGALPGGAQGPLPLKQGPRRPDLLAFYAARKGRTQVVVKTLQGVTVYSGTVDGAGSVSVGDYFDDPGWEIAVQNGATFTFLNPMTKASYVVRSGGGRAVSCISNQTIY